MSGQPTQLSGRKKLAAIGGVSTATLVAVYHLFVTQSSYNEDQRASRIEAAAVRADLAELRAEVAANEAALSVLLALARKKYE